MLKLKFYSKVGLLFLCIACRKENNKVIVKSDEQLKYEALNGGIIWFSKFYSDINPMITGSSYSAISFFFNYPHNVTSDSIGFSNDIGNLVLNGSQMSKDKFGSGLMYKGATRNLPLDITIKGSSDSVLFYRDYADKFPSFSNYKDVPKQIDMKAGFSFTLNNLVNTSSVTVYFYGGNFSRTFTNNVIYFSPALLDSISASSYVILNINLTGDKNYAYFLQGKKFECTYNANYDFRGITIR